MLPLPKKKNRSCDRPQLRHRGGGALAFAGRLQPRGACGGGGAAGGQRGLGGGEWALATGEQHGVQLGLFGGLGKGC